MGCANSNLLPSVLENGEYVAPPYELKQASDKLTQDGQGLIGTAKRMFSSDNVTSKLKETAGDIVDSNPVQTVIGGAVNVKDAALSKIHGTGEAVKQTIGSFTHQTEEKFGQLAHGAEDKLGLIVSDAESKVGDTLHAVQDKIGEFLPVTEETIVPEKAPERIVETEENTPEVEETNEEEANEEETNEEETNEVEVQDVNQENGEPDEMMTLELTVQDDENEAAEEDQEPRSA